MKEAPIYRERQQKRRRLLWEGNNSQSSVKTERAQKAAITILPSWRQRNIEGSSEGSSEEYPIDLVQSGNKKLLECIGTGGDNEDDNNGDDDDDDDDDVVLVMTKPSLEDLSEDHFVRA